MSYEQRELISLTMSQAAGLLQSKHVSSAMLTRACLDRIERLNPILNAFITVTAESALREAELADKEIARGEYRGTLHGIPIALKDLIDTVGVRTTAGSAVYEHRIPERDATVVRKLREAGAVFLGKLNLHEFAYGGSGVISHFGPVRNPWDTSRTTGGSSSGSAAAVASGMCYAALGTDTAGSIRLPASFCGITGLKPTYGLVSAAGVIPLCWTYDHVGPMTRTALDAALLLDVIAGYDPQDPTSLQRAYEPEAGRVEDNPPSGLRLGIAREFFLDDLDAEVAAAFDAAVEVLSVLLGTRPVDVTVPLEKSNVVRVAEPYAYHEPLLEKNANLYQPATLERIRAGAGISATRYLEVRRELEILRRQAVDIFTAFDLILTPTVPCLPSSIDELVDNPAELRPRELRMLRNTRPFNTLGWPTITVPCGRAGKLPIGLQIAAAPGRDGLLLQVAHALETQTRWAERIPVEPDRSK
jgi:aspartyl-tRNA(Asn)/glutamyl-tRNA(Gln) amidotransferase subunit A